MLLFGERITQPELISYWSCRSEHWESLTRNQYSYHTKELFIKYKVLRFPDLVKKQQIMILLGYLNKSLPQPISEMFKYHTPVGTRAAQHFKMPYARTNYKTFALSITAPKAWNTIICKIFKDLADVPRNKYTLKKYVVEYFLDQYSNAPKPCMKEIQYCYLVRFTWLFSFFVFSLLVSFLYLTVPFVCMYVCMLESVGVYGCESSWFLVSRFI